MDDTEQNKHEFLKFQIMNPYPIHSMTQESPTHSLWLMAYPSMLVCYYGTFSGQIRFDAVHHFGGRPGGLVVGVPRVACPTSATLIHR